MQESLVEKHRPKKLDEIFGQDEIIRSVRSRLARKSKANYMFLGSPGTGKTSLALVIAREMFGKDWSSRLHWFNSSKDRGIDIVRKDIARLSRFKGQRIIFLDEADNMTPDAQQALRGLMEEKNDSIWILTGNAEHKILRPIQSRCTIYRFNSLSDYAITKKIIEICKKENFKIGKQLIPAVKKMVEISVGSLRDAIQNLEIIVNENGEITEENVELMLKESPIPKILKTAVSGDFNTAKAMLQKEYILSSYSSQTVVKEIFNGIDQQNEIDNEQKIRLFDKLGDLEFRLRIGCDPLIELVSYLAFIWTVKHRPKTH